MNEEDEMLKELINYGYYTLDIKMLTENQAEIIMIDTMVNLLKELIKED